MIESAPRMIVSGDRRKKLVFDIKHIKGSKRGEMHYVIFMRGDPAEWAKTSTLDEAKILTRGWALLFIEAGVGMVQVYVRDSKGRFYQDITLPKSADPKSSKG